MAEFTFFRKKKFILKFTPQDIALEALAFLALCVGLVVTDRLYPALPETVPAAFASDGSVLKTGLKEITLLHPILATFVYIILTCLNLIVRQSCPPDRPLPVLTLVLNAVSVAKALFLAYQSLLTWYALRLVPAPAFLLRALIAAEAVVGAVTVLLIRRRLPASEKKTAE